MFEVLQFSDSDFNRLFSVSCQGVLQLYLCVCLFPVCPVSVAGHVSVDSSLVFAKFICLSVSFLLTVVHLMSCQLDSFLLCLVFSSCLSPP